LLTPLEEIPLSSRTLYTDAFREQALQKAFNRGEVSITSIAEQLNISHWTLKNWMTKARRIQHNNSAPRNSAGTARPGERSAAERMQFLLDSYGLESEALGAFCRQHGLFTPQLEQWRQAFEHGLTPAPGARDELRELKHSNTKLERELRRKEKALAEAAALLVLQTNFHQLWEDKGE